MSRHQVTGAFVLVLALALGMTPSTSLARFTASRASTGGFATATLMPPTALTGTGGTSTGLAWTASTSAWATGYQVLRSATSGSGYAQVRTVTPVAATSTTDAPANGTWYYVLRTYFGGWTSAGSNEARVVIGPQATGYKGCTNTQAVNPAGDNNGYETNPGNACASDGAVAVDASSGSNTSTTCSNAGKDKHTFWGYAFGLPATISSVQGITVQVIAGTNNGTGTYGMCVDLSWDGGNTWTTYQPMTFATSAMTTYTYGGATNTWGRTWTTATLAGGTFRVRVTDAASIANKTFNLDYVGVSVNYTP